RTRASASRRGYPAPIAATAARMDPMSTTATAVPAVVVTSGVEKERHEWFSADLGDGNNGVSAELIRAEMDTTCEVRFYGDEVTSKRLRFNPRHVAHLAAVLERLRDRVAVLDAAGEI